MKKYLIVLALIFIGTGINAQTYVKGYYRKNGTYVAPHYRSSPNSTKNDNYSTKGNYNPYTGKSGTKDGDYNYSYPSTKTPTTSYTDWYSYTIDEYYKKIDLPTGSMDNYGNSISYVYVKTKAPETGKYDVSISDEEGDMYKIADTEIYLKFTSYYGYAGYGDKGILSISSYSSTFYKEP